MGSDIRFTARQMRRSPVFTALAIVTLSLGIGATTAIFSVVNRFLLNSIPFADGGRIVNLISWLGSQPPAAVSSLPARSCS